jgi:hypothetical protein
MNEEEVQVRSIERVGSIEMVKDKMDLNCVESYVD